MAQYDKYEPKAGGFRAPLNADLVKTPAPIGVGLNASGRVVAGAGATGILGVLNTVKDMKAGKVVDVMTNGEIVEMASLTAGTVITADTTTGALGVTAVSATKTPVGFTVEATRLVVRRSANPFIGT
jgi:hypothetical protein